MRYLVFLYLFGAIFGGYAQQKQYFNWVSEEEKNFKVFKKDTTAAAVVLYEKGDNYFEVRDDFIYLITKYHAKIKILKKSGLDYANIEIPYYKSDNRQDRVSQIKAITHNTQTKHHLSANDIYNVDVSKNWSHKTFTFPNVQVGSILEYTYELQSPFYFNLSGWEFQSSIPKVYSEYHAKIPGNWKYNRSLIGEIKLEINEASIKKNCFFIDGYGTAECEVLKYAMRDVPAFKAEESFMLSANNYKSRLVFELSEYQSLKGYIKKFTKTWDDVDKEFRTDQDLGKQLRKKNFFEDKVPAALLAGGDDLQRAKRIYAFTKAHYTWNKKYGIWKDNNVKKAFSNGGGNAAEINITLINLLNAAGLDAQMMLIATRDRGLPKRNHPVLGDFNYVLAKLTIDGRSYLLDATEKEMPFGMLPFRCLNYYGRVMDFKKDSYWFDIVAEKDSKKRVMAQIEFDLDQGIAKGKLSVTSKTYDGLAAWKRLNRLTPEAYLDELSEEISDDFYFTSHEVIKDKSDERQLIQRFDFEIEQPLKGDEIYFNPNIIKFFSKNPFVAAARHFPIDFGYQRNYAFNLNLKIPEGYALKELPKDRAVALPGQLGLLQFKTHESQGSVLVFFNLKLNASYFSSASYNGIKELFSQAVEAQTKSFIVLEKL